MFGDGRIDEIANFYDTIILDDSKAQWATPLPTKVRVWEADFDGTLGTSEGIIKFKKHDFIIEDTITGTLRVCECDIFFKTYYLQGTW